jgi:hypothetical protein
MKIEFPEVKLREFLYSTFGDGSFYPIGMGQKEPSPSVPKYFIADYHNESERTVPGDS